MNKKIVMFSWNAFSGAFVLLLSLTLMFGRAAFAETDVPDIRRSFLLWFVLWTVGLLLQFKQRTKWLGLSLTIIPTVYYVVRLLRAFELF